MNNMQKREDPHIEPFDKDAFDYTHISFEPDLKRFDIKEISKDMIGLLYKRVYDIAGITPKSTNVYLNGKKLDIKDFSSYVDMYINSVNESEEHKIEKIYEEFGP